MINRGSITIAGLLTAAAATLAAMFGGLQASPLVGAPIQSAQRNITPEADSEYYIGTTTPSTLAFKGIITDELCLTGDSCKTTWPSGSGATSFGDLTDVATSSDAAGDLYYLNSSGQITNLGVGSDGQVLKVSSSLPAWGTDSTGTGGSAAVATSTNETAGYLPYWTSTAGTPALLGKVATTTLTASSPLSLSNPVVKVGGSNSVLTISTTTNSLFTGTQGQVLGYTAGGWTGVATTTFNSPLNYSGGAVTLDTSGTWSGNAGTATALAANGSNCSAGQAASGVDASGAAEGCAAYNTWAFPFTPGSTFATAVNSTSTPIWFTNGLYSSSTITSSLVNGGIGLYVGASGSGTNKTILYANDDATGSAFRILDSSGTYILHTLGTDSIKIGTNNSTSNGLLISGSAGNVTVQSGSLLTAVSGLISQASSTILSLTTINSTSTNATSTNLYVSGQTRLASLTGLVLASTGVTSAYAGTTCTNQFVRSLSASGVATCATVSSGDVSLANLTATDGTLTFSGTYNGSTARTIGLNLGNANTWTALQTINYASTTAITASGELGFPNGSSITTTITGDCVIDTTDSQMKCGNAGSTAVFDPRRFLTFTYATTTTATGTTTLQLGTAPTAMTITKEQCYTNTGTWNVQLYYGSTKVLPMVLASSTAGILTTTSNNTPSASDKLSVDVGTPASTPTTISCTFTATITGT